MMLNVFRQILIWLLIVAAVSLAVDYLRRPALPQNFSSMPLQTLDGRTVDLAAMSHERPLLLYVWATWCGVCRYTTPSVAALANDGGNVMTVALRSGDNAALARWLAHKKWRCRRSMTPAVSYPNGGRCRSRRPLSLSRAAR